MGWLQSLARASYVPCEGIKHIRSSIIETILSCYRFWGWKNSKTSQLICSICGGRIHRPRGELLCLLGRDLPNWSLVVQHLSLCNRRLLFAVLGRLQQIVVVWILNFSSMWLLVGSFVSGTVFSLDMHRWSRSDLGAFLRSAQGSECIQTALSLV